MFSLVGLLIRHWLHRQSCTTVCGCGSGCGPGRWTMIKLLAQDVAKHQNHRRTHDRHAQSARLSPHTFPRTLSHDQSVRSGQLAIARPRPAVLEANAISTGPHSKQSRDRIALASDPLERAHGCEFRHACREVPLCPRSDGVHNMVELLGFRVRWSLATFSSSSSGALRSFCFSLRTVLFKLPMRACSSCRRVWRHQRAGTWQHQKACPTGHAFRI
jgi:hypothetical protein